MKANLIYIIIKKRYRKLNNIVFREQLIAYFDLLTATTNRYKFTYGNLYVKYRKTSPWNYSYRTEENP